MHGTMNLKFANAKQAKDTYEYRKEFLKDFMTGASRWILFTTIIVDARNHEPEICECQTGKRYI
jgi:hypothetical protein